MGLNLNLGIEWDIILPTLIIVVVIYLFVDRIKKGL
jgi:hypothetical protein